MIHLPVFIATRGGVIITSGAVHYFRNQPSMFVGEFEPSGGFKMKCYLGNGWRSSREDICSIVIVTPGKMVFDQTEGSPFPGK